MRQRLLRLEAALGDAQAELRDAVAKKTSYEEELKTPMRQQLTQAEVQSLEALTKEAEEQKKALAQASKSRIKVSQAAREFKCHSAADIQVSSEKSNLDIELTESFRRRREELRGKLDDLEGDAGSGVLQEGEVELRNAELRNLIASIEQLGEQAAGW